MSVVQQLAKDLSRLPGIGPKTALRLVHHLLKGSADDTRRLARSLEDLATRVHPCPVCGNFTEGERCDVCLDARRDRTVVCVVEEAFQIDAIDRTGQYRGLYHVLGGHLSPLDGVGPDELSIGALLHRIGESDGEIAEIILATNASVEGEATSVYLEHAVRPLGPRVTRLARGIPVGSDLEYVDGSTIAEALAGRREA